MCVHLLDGLYSQHSAVSSIGKRKGNSTRLCVKSASVFHACYLQNNRDTAVSTVTDCGLDYPGFDSRQQHIFLFSSTTDRPSGPPSLLSGDRSSFQSVSRPKCEADETSRHTLNNVVSRSKRRAIVTKIV